MDVSSLSDITSSGVADGREEQARQSPAQPWLLLATRLSVVPSSLSRRRPHCKFRPQP